MALDVSQVHDLCHQQELPDQRRFILYSLVTFPGIGDEFLVNSPFAVATNTVLGGQHRLHKRNARGAYCHSERKQTLPIGRSARCPFRLAEKEADTVVTNEQNATTWRDAEATCKADCGPAND
jgi:hypothetical protein